MLQIADGGLLMSRGRILVVEDNPDLNRLVVELLDGWGYTPCSVTDGAAALEKLNTLSFDLVLLDLELPKVSGFEVLQQLRNRSGAPKVIVMTGDDTPETILRVVQ